MGCKFLLWGRTRDAANEVTTIDVGFMMLDDALDYLWIGIKDRVDPCI